MNEAYDALIDALEMSTGDREAALAMVEAYRVEVVAAVCSRLMSDPWRRKTAQNAAVAFAREITG